MTQRLFLYIDILGFKNLVQSPSIIEKLYRRIDQLHVQTDKDFTCIVFSDTILVYSHDGWLAHPNEAVMWLIEFAQDLFFQVISLNIHFRAYVTMGEFEHKKMKHIEAYYGRALVKCYEREKAIKCSGVFLDAKLAKHSDIFHLTKFDSHSFYVHVMQHLDDLSQDGTVYPIEGWILKVTDMDAWTAYAFYYLRNIYRNAHDKSLSADVRLKFSNAWKMVASRHGALCQQLIDCNFDFRKVVDLNWTPLLKRIGTAKGAYN